MRLRSAIGTLTRRRLTSTNPDVGRAVKDSGIAREEIFVTSKLWLQDHGYEAAKKAVDVSLQKLGLDYMDLFLILVCKQRVNLCKFMSVLEQCATSRVFNLHSYLIHQPYGDVPGAWQALEEAKQAGKIKSIGVSNMSPKIYSELVPQFSTLPAVNQVECNPTFQQKELRKLMDKDDVKLEAWYPLGHGNRNLLENPAIVKMAQKYGKNTGQIILRFEVQEGFIILPKSTNPERIAGNINIFDFELTDEEMNTIRAMDTGKGSHDPYAPGVGDNLLRNYKIHD